MSLNNDQENFLLNERDDLKQRIADLEQERGAFKLEMEALLDIYKQWKVVAVKDGLCASVAITIAKMHQDLTQKLTDLRTAMEKAKAELRNNTRLVTDSRQLRHMNKVIDILRAAIERSR